MQILLNTKTLEHFTLLSMKIINCHSDIKHSKNECFSFRKSTTLYNIVQIIDNGECNPFDTEEINNNNIFIYRH